MFEAAELGQAVSKAEYKEQVPPLRQSLLDLQQKLRRADFPVIVLFAGVDAAGKGEAANLLNAWMDPRWLLTRAYSESSQEERERPEFWRYWRDLPRRGRIGLFLSAWYSTPVVEQAYGKSDSLTFDRQLDRVVAFEGDLANDGALIVKFWMHLGKRAQKRRLKKLASNPLTSWQVTETDWEHWKLYDRFAEAGERAILRTSTGAAPWTIVEGEDQRYASLKVGLTLRDAIDRRLGQPPSARPQALQTAAAGPERVENPSMLADKTILSSLDMGVMLSKEEYTETLRRYQGRLNKAQREARAQGISSLLVFEGWDAAGKGGAIRRVTSALDARDYEVHQTAAPSDEERSHHYLWRFWRHLGRAGRVVIFDRSWYGRVLVERVEGFATEAEWMRAYGEITDFEDQLVQHGIVLLKFWLHITPEEQLQRFRDREDTPYKRWKITEEDWRNRARWADYELAGHDMVERTSMQAAPWTLVEANDKRFARVKVVQTFAESLEAALEKR